jgi:hypothetical protein
MYSITLKQLTQQGKRIMLNIQIDNPEIENNIKQIYGDNSGMLMNAFFEFIQQQKIKQDVGVSINQLDNGEGILLNDVIDDIAFRYE